MKVSKDERQQGKDKGTKQVTKKETRTGTNLGQLSEDILRAPRRDFISPTRKQL